MRLMPHLFASLNEYAEADTIERLRFLFIAKRTSDLQFVALFLQFNQRKSRSLAFAFSKAFDCCFFVGQNNLI